MENEILELMINSFLEDILNQSKKILIDIFEDGKQFINDNIGSYLKKQNKRFSIMKTLLHGGTQIHLYDIYYPLKIKYENEIFNTSSVEEIFKNHSCISLIGEAGSGKSTLVRHLFLNSIKEKYGIPILIELRHLNSYPDSFEEYILNKIFDYDLTENEKILTRLLKNGKFIFFLDGFDEISSSVQPKKINEFNTFIEKYSKCKFFLTTRPYSNIEYHPLFSNHELCSLDKSDVFQFIDLQLKSESELAERIKKSLIETEENIKFRYIKSFLNNPLLLSLYILTFQSNPVIPDKKYIFYRRVVNALFSEHDSKSKLGYVREFESGLAQFEFEEILKRFCFMSHFDNLYYFEYDYLINTLGKLKNKIPNIDFNTDKLIKDLLGAVSLWIEDCGLYSFAHRSIQEFYASVFIKSLDYNNKKELYEKLMNKLANFKLSDIENLLFLCKEMDTLFYLKHIENPLLNELKNGLLTDNDEKRFRYFFSLFFESMSINITNWEIKIYNNSSTNKFQLITKNLQGRLFNEIKKTFQNNIEPAQKAFRLKDSVIIISSKSSVYQNMNLFDFIGINSIIRKYIEELNLQIANNEDYIKKTSDSDKELISMI